MEKKRNYDLNNLKWYTFDEVLERTLTTPEMRREYEEEVARTELAREIKQARMKKRLTQEAVATKANMPQSVIARAESGRHSVSFSTLIRIAVALGKKVQLVA